MPDRRISIPGFNSQVSRQLNYSRLRRAVLDNGGIDHEFTFSLADVLSISNFYSFRENCSVFYAQFEHAIYELSEEEYHLIMVIFI